MGTAEHLEIKKRAELTEKQIAKADAFVMKESTTGEFINTFRFLDYHPEGRFQDDSIVVLDKGSGEVRGVMMAARGDGDSIVSYPGTTFAGPVLDRAARLEATEAALDIMLGYYESRYSGVKIRKQPEYYAAQPFHLIDYILLRRGYTYGMAALANIICIDGIETEEDIPALFHAKRRNQVRKVIKEGQFMFSAQDEIREAVWKNMNENLRNKFEAKTTHTLEEIRELQSRFPDRIRAFYADAQDGAYGAFALCFLFKNVFHTQYLDVNYEYAGQYPNLLLILKLIRQARESGYRYFSFGASTEDGGNVLNRGLYGYKAEYGGGDILLPVYTKRM